eukprot:g6688.t1
MGMKGWADPDLRSGVKLHGDGCRIGVPHSGCTGWSVEIAFPLASIAYNNSAASLPLRPGKTYWRINFSRVEWRVRAPPGRRSYEKVPGLPEDNWVWAPTNVVDIHLPEYWGYIQFAPRGDPINATALRPDPDWTVRHVAMQLYAAQLAYQAAHNGSYTADLSELASLAPGGAKVFGCVGKPTIVLDGGEEAGGGGGGEGEQKDSGGYRASLPSADGRRIAHIQGDRLLTVVDAT